MMISNYAINRAALVCRSYVALDVLAYLRIPQIT